MGKGQQEPACWASIKHGLESYLKVSWHGIPLYRYWRINEIYLTWRKGNLRFMLISVHSLFLDLSGTSENIKRKTNACAQTFTQNESAIPGHFFSHQNILEPTEFIGPVHWLSNFLHFILGISQKMRMYSQTSHVWLHMKRKLLKNYLNIWLNFFKIHGGFSRLPAYSSRNFKNVRRWIFIYLSDKGIKGWFGKKVRTNQARWSHPKYTLIYEMLTAWELTYEIAAHFIKQRGPKCATLIITKKWNTSYCKATRQWLKWVL